MGARFASTVFPGASYVAALVDRSAIIAIIDIAADFWRNEESQTFHKKKALRGKDADKTKKRWS